MTRHGLFTGAGILLAGMTMGALLAQTTPQPAPPAGAQPAAAPAPQPFAVGNRLGLPVLPSSERPFSGISPNVKVHGAIYSAESCVYDPTRDLIVVPNRGVPQSVQANNAWISLINHDGSVHTARWLGVQTPAERAAMTPPLVLNEPFGSDLVNGLLYVADRDGGTTPTEPSVAVVRWFNLRTGAPVGQARVEGSPWLNDIAVAADGTIYGTQTGANGPQADAATWVVWKIAKDGAVSRFLQGAPLRQPNGIALDRDGNIVVLNMGTDEILTFAPDAKLLKTERAAQTGSDGIVIMPDGTKYISSVTNGGISRLRPNQPAELIAEHIPSAASMCYDAGANQLVIPMNANNALAFVSLK